MLLEHLTDGRVALLALQRVEVDDGPVELVVDVDGRDGDEGQPLVVDPHQLLGDDLAQGLPQPGRPRVAMATRTARLHLGEAIGKQ